MIKDKMENNQQLLSTVKEFLEFAKENDLTDECANDGDGHFDTWQSSELSNFLVRLQNNCEGKESLGCEENVIDKIYARRNIGLKKYGISVKDNPLPTIDWLNHLQEELLDGAIYIERLKQDLITPQKNREL